MARGKELGVAGDTQRSFWYSGKQFAFISEINPQMPSDLEAWEYLLQRDSAEEKPWPEWEGSRGWAECGWGMGRGGLSYGWPPSSVLVILASISSS